MSWILKYFVIIKKKLLRVEDVLGVAMCYGFVPVENPTSFVLKSPQKILHKIRPVSWKVKVTGKKQKQNKTKQNKHVARKR